MVEAGPLPELGVVVGEVGETLARVVEDPGRAVAGVDSGTLLAACVQ
ncbi:MAG: hypothetical protein ABSD48_09310 [Armatimonadota bacterium]|jgi:hypothetical protein